MTIKTFKPITPSLRHRIIIKKPKKTEEPKFLVKGYTPSFGRNKQGLITSSKRGGKAKAKKNLRIIDWARELGNYSKCEVENINYNPYSSGWIAKIKIKKEENILENKKINLLAKKNKFIQKNISFLSKDKFFYILAPSSLSSGDIFYGSYYKDLSSSFHSTSITNFDITSNISMGLKYGENRKIKDLPIGSKIYNVKKKEEIIYKNVDKSLNSNFSIFTFFKGNKKNLFNTKFELNSMLRLYKFSNLFHSNSFYSINSGLFARSAGTCCLLIKKTVDDLNKKRAIIRLPSKKLISISEDCFASFGQVSNESHELIVKGKAGVNRWLGKRPHVRGEAQNPVDHPHGGKSHGSGGLGNPQKTKQGKLAKWQKKRKI